MTRSLPTHAGLLVLVAALYVAPAGAASSAASSASDSASDSVGSLSKSSNQSSDSSSGDKKVAAGDYRIIEMAAVEDQPAMVRVRLQAISDGQAVVLTLPRQATVNGHLAQGQVLTANARPYGLELVAGVEKKAFFLLVDDDWHRELANHPVVL